jgi:cell division protein ZipA
MAMELNFDAHGDGDYLHTDPALYDEVERKIVAVNLVARGSAFSGAAIAKACSAVQLRLGEMSIYHYHDGASGAVLFSMASMVEPGVFPAADLEDFSTPGLSLFTQLPGARDGVAIYDALLATAKKLGTLLDGELQDDRHNKLTRQMEEHMRESIIEHRRKINLARRRH